MSDVESNYNYYIAIKILYKNTKVKVRSPDGNTDFFDRYTARVHISLIPLYYLPRLRAPKVDRFNERK